MTKKNTIKKKLLTNTAIFSAVIMTMSGTPFGKKDGFNVVSTQMESIKNKVLFNTLIFITPNTANDPKNSTIYKLEKRLADSKLFNSLSKKSQKNIKFDLEYAEKWTTKTSKAATKTKTSLNPE